MDLTPYVLGWISAMLVGFSKTGMPGVSIPAILLMAEAFPEDAKLSLGAILPVLLAGDVFAVAWYRHHADWKRLAGLFPFVAAGMAPGTALLWWIDGNQLRPVLGGLILGLLALEAFRRCNEARRRPDPQDACRTMPNEICICRAGGQRSDDCCARGWGRQPSGPPARFTAAWWFMAALGALAGFATVIANAAMPVMTIYFLRNGMLKQQFIGTAAWFFFLINLSKLPICLALGVITPKTIQFGLIVAPATLVGALAGVLVLTRVPQRFFDAMALSLAGMAAIRLIVV